MNINFKITFFVGLFTLLIAVYMKYYQEDVKPQSVSNVAYQKAPMLAFEFAKDSSDINKLFLMKGNTKKNTAFIDKMKGLNRIDFLFIVSYSLFLFCFSIAISKQNIYKLGYLGAIVAVIIGLADVMENVQLLSILNKVNVSATYQPELTSLNTWTWIKWGLLSVLMVVLLPCLLRKGSHIYSLILGIMMACVAILGLVAFVFQCPAWIVRYTSLIFLLFPIIILYSVARWKISANT